MSERDWEDIHREIGRRVSQERVRLKMTVAEFARRCGLLSVKLEEIERGKKCASVRQLYQIADAAGCAVTELMPR